MSEWWLLGILLILTLICSILFIRPLKGHSSWVLLLIPVFFIAAGSAYYTWGGFVSWAGFLHQEQARTQAQQMLKSIKNPQELIDRLRAKLNDTPESAKGWYLLGRLYSSQNDEYNAVKAFAKACQFKPNNEHYAVNYAHSLWVSQNRQFTPELRALFIKLITKNPKQVDSLAMLAIDSFEQNKYQQAIEYWQRLLPLAQANSEEAREIRKAIAKAQEHLNQKEQ